MKNRYDDNEVDSTNIMEQEINGCNVRLFFTVEQNANLKGMVLDNLIQVIQRKKQDVSSVQTQESHLRHA
jgi:hypothetical protein